MQNVNLDVNALLDLLHLSDAEGFKDMLNKMMFSANVTYVINNYYLIHYVIMSCIHWSKMQKIKMIF